jgi:3-hydroxyisobutyrate dehydrogenase-like beta-hydroxyacid dehydrogenase
VITLALKRVGFIGLGAMGFPMAQNLIKRGYELHISANRNRGPVERLTQAGAVEHASITDVAQSSDVLITILPTDKEMEAVLLSQETLEALKPGTMLIEMTSGSPAMMKRIGEAYRLKGVLVLDGPVSGGTVGAEQGTLTVMAGGDVDALEQARPILDVMAKNIFHVGAIGAGKAIKAINQMMAGIHMIALTEAAALAEKLEIDSNVLKSVIGSSSGSSWMLMNKLDGVTNRNFIPGFKLSLMRKDIQIAASEATGLDLALTEKALALFQKSESQYGDQDFSAVGKSLLS